MSTRRAGEHVGDQPCRSLQVGQVAGCTWRCRGGLDLALVARSFSSPRATSTPCRPPADPMAAASPMPEDASACPCRRHPAADAVGQAGYHRRPRASRGGGHRDRRGRHGLLVAGARRSCGHQGAVEAAGGTAHVHPCDLTDLEAIEQAGRRLLTSTPGRHPGEQRRPSIRRSLALSYDRFHDYQRTMQLNYFAPVRLMLGVLPGCGSAASASDQTFLGGRADQAPRFGPTSRRRRRWTPWPTRGSGDQGRQRPSPRCTCRWSARHDRADHALRQFPALTRSSSRRDHRGDHRPPRGQPRVRRFAFLADAITPRSWTACATALQDVKTRSGDRRPRHRPTRNSSAVEQHSWSHPRCTGEGTTR